MQAQKEAPPDMQCKDKFLLQSALASPGATTKDITPEMVLYVLHCIICKLVKSERMCYSLWSCFVLFRFEVQQGVWESRRGVQVESFLCPATTATITSAGRIGGRFLTKGIGF